MATHSSILAWRIPWKEDSPRNRKEAATTEQLTANVLCRSGLKLSVNITVPTNA